MAFELSADVRGMSFGGRWGSDIPADEIVFCCVQSWKTGLNKKDRFWAGDGRSQGCRAPSLSRSTCL